MIRRTPILLAVAALALLPLTACGDDEGGSGGGGGDASALSKAELTEQANTICTTADKALDAVQQPSDIADPAVATAYFEQLLPIVKTRHDALAALEPGDAEKAAYDAFVAVSERGTTLVTEITAKARARDASGMALLEQLDPLDEEAVRTAKAAGLSECG